MSVSNIIESVRNYWLSCPILDDGSPLNVDYIDDIMSYSIDVLPVSPIYRQYVDGSSIRQFAYTITSKRAYDGDARTMIGNTGLLQSIEEWLDAEAAAGHFPEIEGHRVQSHTVTTTGYLFSTDSDLARYQIQLRLLYT